MSEPLVSAVIPVHDGARFLAEAIESVLAQQYAPVELIVVDDGSRDESRRIAGAYPDVRTVELAGKGVSAARNAGVAVARGKVLAFLDQDDLWTPLKLTVQVAVLAADPAVGFALGRQRIFLDGVSEPPWLRLASLDGEHVGYFPGTLAVRREVFERVGPFREEAPPAEGADWFLRAAELGVQRAIVPEVVLLKRVHDRNQSGDMRAARSQVLRAIKQSLDRRRERSG